MRKDVRRVRRSHSRPNDRGQIAVEAAGMTALIFITVMMLWQAILVGYTLMLASRAADQSAREAAVQLPSSDAADRGEAFGMDSLPDAWARGAEIHVSLEGDRTRADVTIQVPLVVPGWTDLPMSVSSSSGARA